MKFDTVIIGGGLAGLLCGLSLIRRGLRCAIISRGQSGLHFSSGSFDLLANEQEREKALDILASEEPNHPYSLLGKNNVLAYAQQTEQLLVDCGIALQGSYQQNHQRVTPLGTLRQAWLSPPEAATLPLHGLRVAVVGISGFADFQPHLTAASLQKSGVQAQALDIELPALDALRENPSEFRSVTIARLLDNDSQWHAVLDALMPIAREHEHLILPACFGLQDNSLWQWLNDRLPCPLSLLPTLPPSVPGIRLHTALQQQFVRQGGIWLAGDVVTRVVHDDRHISAIMTRNHAEIPLRTQYAVLASGSFFSNGLIATREGVTEPVMRLDVIQSAPRESWYARDVFSPQPWQRFGVRTDASLRPQRNGQPFDNLFAIGGVLGGFDAIEQGCGAGVSAVTALHAAHQIAELAGGQR